MTVYISLLWVGPISCASELFSACARYIRWWSMSSSSARWSNDFSQTFCPFLLNYFESFGFFWFKFVVKISLLVFHKSIYIYKKLSFVDKNLNVLLSLKMWFSTILFSFNQSGVTEKKLVRWLVEFAVLKIAHLHIWWGQPPIKRCTLLVMDFWRRVPYTHQLSTLRCCDIIDIHCSFHQ